MGGANPVRRVSGPPVAVAAIRVAVRTWLAATPLTDGAPITVAVSGGADSLALCAAVVFEAGRTHRPVHVATVDHGLQAGSAARADDVAALTRALGVSQADVLTVRVKSHDGPEADARHARYAALREYADGGWVLLGHTLDDQAETVLLGLGRGSGPRSIAGMAAHTEHGLSGGWGRPLLGVRRAQTEAACAASGLPVWTDPHNADPRFTRARLRHEVLPLLDDVLGGGVAEALARTAGQLSALESALDTYAEQALAERRTPDGLDRADTLAALPAAVRVRVVGTWLREQGVGPLNAAQLGAVDRLVVAYRGQGEVALPHGAGVVRRRARLVLLDSTDPQEGDPRVRR